MHAYQIVAGFSEIKSQLRIKANLKKSLGDLQLWFSFEESEAFILCRLHGFSEFR